MSAAKYPRRAVAFGPPFDDGTVPEPKPRRRMKQASPSNGAWPPTSEAMPHRPTSRTPDDTAQDNGARALAEAITELDTIAMLPVYLPPKPEDEDDRYLLRGAVLALVESAKRDLSGLPDAILTALSARGYTLSKSAPDRPRLLTEEWDEAYRKGYAAALAATPPNKPAP